MTKAITATTNGPSHMAIASWPSMRPTFVVKSCTWEGTSTSVSFGFASTLLLEAIYSCLKTLVRIPDSGFKVFH